MRAPSLSSGSGSNRAEVRERRGRDSTSSAVFDDGESVVSGAMEEDDDEGGPEWDQDWEDERLPPNAVMRARQKRRRSTAASQAMRPPMPRIDSQAVAPGDGDETPMLRSPPLSSSPPAEAIPFARAAPRPTSFGSIKPIEEVDSPESTGSTIKVAYERHPSASSTALQTLFNSINVLVGVSILAEPLAFAQAGWIFSFVVLTFCGLVTNWTCVPTRYRPR